MEKFWQIIKVLLYQILTEKWILHSKENKHIASLNLSTAMNINPHESSWAYVTVRSVYDPKSDVCMLFFYLEDFFLKCLIQHYSCILNDQLLMC